MNYILKLLISFFSLFKRNSIKQNFINNPNTFAVKVCVEYYMVRGVNTKVTYVIINQPMTNTAFQVNAVRIKYGNVISFMKVPDGGGYHQDSNIPILDKKHPSITSPQFPQWMNSKIWINDYV